MKGNKTIMAKIVLVVDDSKSQQLLMEGILKGMGINVAKANDGESALDWLKNNPTPDLIFMDIVMPNMTGFDTCRKIRNQLNIKEVPIIFCSQKNQEFDQFWALRQGGNSYLIKPYSPIDLINKVKEYL
jgi:twitching motility two-component system response regulator PilH